MLVCSAVPREMLDSHLFGHRRGAFTGAIDNFLGVIRANEGGTLFLDEIGEVSLDLQVKLLRFLETGEVHPLGETKPVKVDVRVIAATNQPLEALIKEGRFREDLFYRLNVVRIPIPPLRERREEILPFFERFLMRECARIGRPVPNLSDEAVEHLLLYTWPGNVRQLLNEVKRVLATLPAGAEITPATLSSDITEERQAAIAKRGRGVAEPDARADRPAAGGGHRRGRAGHAQERPGQQPGPRSSGREAGHHAQRPLPQASASRPGYSARLTAPGGRDAPASTAGVG